MTVRPFQILEASCLHLLDKKEQLPKTGAFYSKKNGVIRDSVTAPVGLCMLVHKCKPGEHETRTPQKTLELRR